MTSHCGALIGLTFTYSHHIHLRPLPGNPSYTEILKSTLRLLTVSAAAEISRRLFSVQDNTFFLPSLLLCSLTVTRGLPPATHAVLHVVGVQNAKFLQNAVLPFQASSGSRCQRLSLCHG